MRLTAVLAMAILATAVFAADTTHVADPTQVPDETAPRINVGDFPMGFDVDSWQGPATGKTNWHARYIADGDYLSAIFPTEAATLKFSDIASISYFTNRPAGTLAGRDWWIQIYTRADTVDDCASWYGYRFINNYNDHSDIGSWTQHATNDAIPMTFNGNASCEITGELTLADMILAYGDEEIEMFSVQTDSGWNGFDGYIDGLEIVLVNGSIGRVNFENVPALPTVSLPMLVVLGIGLIALLTFAIRRGRQTA